MRRRRLLGTVAAGLAGSTAGCLGGLVGERGRPSARSDASRPAPDGPAGPQSAASGAFGVGDTPLPVPRTELRHLLPRDYIPAIVAPAFARDWRGLTPDAGATATLPTDAAVIGVERGGRARAYPLRILDHHDSFGGPIAVTYCVLCGSGVVVERRVAGAATVFGVSGTLWRSDLVMYDRASDSLWSQLAATAIRGPRTGDRLRILPSTLTTWGEWRRTHPDTRVLLPPPASGTIPGWDRSFDYATPKYDYGGETQLVGFDSHDGTLHPKTLVVSVTADGVTRAYPFPVVSEDHDGVIHDRVGSLPVVVATAPDGALVAYDRWVDGEVRRFRAHDADHLVAGGSRWARTTGTASDGPHAGRTLRRANDLPPMFWLGWSKFNPDGEVYGTGPLYRPPAKG
jgi:hypothetical protein